MGWAERRIQRGLCGFALEFLPELPGSGSGHGSGRAHGLHSPHNPAPKQCQWASGSQGRGRVGGGASASRRARDQRRRSAPHFVKRVVPECAASSSGEPNPAEVLGCLSIWAPNKRPNQSTSKIGRPNKARSLSISDLERVPWHQSKAF